MHKIFLSVLYKGLGDDRKFTFTVVGPIDNHPSSILVSNRGVETDFDVMGRGVLDFPSFILDLDNVKFDGLGWFKAPVDSVPGKSTYYDLTNLPHDAAKFKVMTFAKFFHRKVMGDLPIIITPTRRQIKPDFDRSAHLIELNF